MSTALLSYEEAAALVAASAAQLRRCAPAVERVALDQAAGRVLAQPLIAESDQPPFARSTRDGFAVRASEASGHSPLPLAGLTRAGEPLPGPLPRGAAWEIMTGAAVPAGADAVVMLEHVETLGGSIRLLPPRAVAAGENIVARGAQARQGDTLLPVGTAIGFAQIALAAACGGRELDVFVRPRVAILTTGDELVPVDAVPAPGQIRNSNGPMLAALVAAAGGDPWVLPAAADTAAALDAALARAVESDLLLITGGVSAGKFDLVEPALARIGAHFHFTGIRIQPGKPTVFGDLPAAVSGPNPQSTKRCFFGLPGNPISSAVTFLLFAAPVLRALAGSNDPGPRFVLAQLAAAVKGKAGLTRFLPASCTFGAFGKELPQVAPVPWQGSGDMTAMARANCFLVLPEEAHHLEPGATVRILLP